MKVSETALPGVLIIEPEVFCDSRGYFFESWHAARYQAANIPDPFVQANVARSTREVLRGLHYQLTRPQGKLMWVTRGEVFDVAVDIRRESITFGKWVGALLSEDNHRQLYIPPGFAHGYCVLSDLSDLMYLCTDLYAPSDEFGIRWDDHALDIDWPISSPKVSDKDRIYPTLREIPQKNLPSYNGGGT